MSMIATAPSAWSPSRLRRLDPVLSLVTLVLVALVIVAVLAPVFAPYPPDQIDILAANQAPSPSHLLGTDSLGRDILSRLIYGARLTFLGPTLIILLATVAGVTLTISSVWLGGIYDRVVSRALDILFAVPGLLVAVIAVAVIGPGLVAPVIALALAYTPYIARVLRSIAMRERHLAYIDAGTLMGISGWAMCRRHLLPNVMPMVRAQAALAFGAALVDLSAVSYIGLGVQPPAAEWGVMVANGQAALLNGYPWEALSAGIAIVVVVLLVNVAGERLALRLERPR
jgi:peptide/nickel transport system permease protein